MNTEKITNQNVTGLWPIPLVRTSIDPVGDDVMDFLINQDTRPKTEGIAQNSYNAFVLNDPICKDLKEALEFINAVGEMAETLNHHPKIINIYKY